MGFPYLHLVLGQALANSVDLDQMPQNAASDLGLHCLPLIQQILDTSTVVKWACSNLRIRMVKSVV